MERAPTAVAIAVGAGLCGAVQPKINAVLGDRVGSPIVASLVNFAVALVFVIVALSVRPATRATLRGVRSWAVPGWMLTAGLGGAVVVLAGAIAVDTIGVAVFSVAFFAGQITFGLLVDRIGVGPGGMRPITASRLQAVVLALAAVGVAQLGRPVGELAPDLIAFVIAAGAAVAFQSAFNGRITNATGDPLAATALNVVVGAVALAALVAVLAAADQLGRLRWPSEPWLYTGGALGVTIVLSLAIATAVLGVLRTTVAMLAAQMIAAIGVDWVIDNEPPEIGVITGAALIVVAVALLGRGAALSVGGVADEPVEDRAAPAP